MCEILSLKDALELYQTQYTQVDKLWSYFGTCTLAVLGFSIGSEKATKSMLEVVVILAGYLVFCAGNYNALCLGQKQLTEFANLAIQAASNQKIDFRILQPLPPEYISIFYWCVVAAVCIGIVVIARKRQRNSRRLN
ncbi:hypothetical protein D3C76_1329920 [compost metagenome]